VRIKGFAIATLVPIVTILIALAAAPPFAPTPANATPGYARQTGVSCQACHTVFPELTPFGRAFKLNGYVFTNVKQLSPVSEQSTRTLVLSELAPFSVQLQASHTLLNKSIPDSDPAVSDLSQKNTTEFPQALSLFYTGSISDKLGAFLQLTWNPSSNAVGMDNSDLRFADHGAFESIGVPDFIYGITLNNNPTSQDVWSSTPAWGYPFIVTNVGVPPVAKVLLDGQLAQQSVGLGAYLYLLNHLYVEASAYRSAPTNFTNATTNGPGPLDSTTGPRIAGVAAPYWRVAWEQDWDNHALTLGTFGMWAPTHPEGVGESGPTDTFTDIGLDVQYQYIGGDHIFSSTATWLHEMRTFNNVAVAEHNHGTLDTVRLTGTYYYRRMFGGSVLLFSTTGSRDDILYAAGTPVLGTASGSPDTQGATFELDFLPWLNTKLGVQYTIFTKFNGRTYNYDDAGRNASGNNTLFVYVWTAF
jgi:hypothetical protein